jgi:putative transposase
MRYAFIKAHQNQHAIRLLCQAAHVHRSGYYAWLQQPQSLRTKEDNRLLGLIKRSWIASGCVYGYRKVHHDLRELGVLVSLPRETVGLVNYQGKLSDS